MKELYNLFLFLAICFVVYLLFRSFHLDKPFYVEGMTNNKDSSRFSKVAEPKSENPQFEDFRRRPQNPNKPPI
jgi:hypothetical protein